MPPGWRELIDSPGGALLHPVALISIALLVLNDHWWKWEFSNWWTGKLSDIAGLIFFPLLLQSFWELGRTALGRPFRSSRRVLVVCAIATAAVFSAINLWEPASHIYRFGLGALAWPLHAAVGLVTSGSLPPYAPVSMVMDPTDLVAVPAIAIAVAIGWDRCHTG